MSPPLPRLIACLALASASFASPSLAQDNPTLPVAAAASGRPRECGPDRQRPDQGWHVNFWDGVRQPLLRRYCDLLGRAQARLASSPDVAREAAGLADQILPGHAAPWVLHGRANVLMGDYAHAVGDFDRAKTIDPRSVEDPQALVDMAAALRRAGKPDDALAAYRILVTRLGLLPSPETRVHVILEAASLAMSRGASGLPEAVAILREGVRQPLTRYDADVNALLLLALDRSDAPAEAASLVEHLALTGAPAALAARDPESFSYLQQPAESAAIVAIALERSDPAASAAAWERYIKSSPASPFLAQARRHLELMRKAPKPLPPRKPVPGRP